MKSRIVGMRMGTMNDRETWLASLKVGDKVAMDSTTFGLPTYTFFTITKIPPKRGFFIVVSATGREVNLEKRGYTRRTVSWGSSSFIEPITEKVKDANRRANMVRSITGIEFRDSEIRDLPIEVLRQASLHAAKLNILITEALKAQGD